MKVLILSLFLAVSCASTPKDLNKISLGMTKDQVTERLGDPDSTSADSPYILYNYGMSVPKENHIMVHVITFGLTLFDRKEVWYAVKFKDGRVTAFGPTEDVSLRKAEDNRKPANFTNNNNITFGDVTK